MGCRYSCHFGHNWCVEMPPASTKRNQVKQISSLQLATSNFGLSQQGRSRIVKGMFEPREVRRYITRQNKFQCLIMDCENEFYLQTVCSHLRQEHPYHYICQPKSEICDNDFNELAKLLPRNF